MPNDIRVGDIVQIKTLDELKAIWGDELRYHPYTITEMMKEQCGKQYKIVEIINDNKYRISTDIEDCNRMWTRKDFELVDPNIPKQPTMTSYYCGEWKEFKILKEQIYYLNSGKSIRICAIKLPDKYSAMEYHTGRKIADGTSEVGAISNAIDKVSSMGEEETIDCINSFDWVNGTNVKEARL